ncbi:hypothetical protein AB0M28_08580 [Streptomyces sp. NPDC051940]|uniref:hypothetical protein n=1 Tax=Streptomyces sp. NPDC051940 TaxID=3155675 RepID=UPI0034337396
MNAPYPAAVPDGPAPYPAAVLHGPVPYPAAFAAVPYGPLPDPGWAASLTATERASLGTARPAERAAAIMAAKLAVLRLLPGLTARDVEVLRRHGCAPALRIAGLDGPPPSLSLAHSDGLAVAALLGGVP